MTEALLPGTAFSTGIVSVGGYDLAYAEAGAGEVLVSLPGSGGIEMSRGKDLLAKRYRVIEINPPGWGDRDDVVGRIDQKDLANLLADAIESLGVDRYHLLGTSMGGVNATWLALHHPDRVQSLVLDAAMTFMAPQYAHNPQMDGFISALSAGTATFDPAMLDKIPAPLPIAAMPWKDHAHFKRTMGNRFRMFAHFTNLAEAELNLRARTIACPVLAMIGSKDEILKPEIRENYARLMPQASFELVPEGTHDMQGSHPAAYATAILTFLESIER